MRLLLAQIICLLRCNIICSNIITAYLRCNKLKNNWRLTPKNKDHRTSLFNFFSFGIFLYIFHSISPPIVNRLKLYISYRKGFVARFASYRFHSYKTINCEYVPGRQFLKWRFRYVKRSPRFHDHQNIP